MFLNILFLNILGTQRGPRRPWRLTTGADVQMEESFLIRGGPGIVNCNLKSDAKLCSFTYWYVLAFVKNLLVGLLCTKLHDV